MVLTPEELRKKIPLFFPPQFFKKLDPKEEVQIALMKALI